MPLHSLVIPNGIRGTAISASSVFIEASPVKAAFS